MTFSNCSRFMVSGWLLLVCAAAVGAQDDLPESGIEYPLQVIHAAGVDRLQEKADALFFAGNRPEMSDVMQNWIDNTLRGMKGLDRTRPFGMMIYIKPGLVPGIAAITYLPVTDTDDLLQWLAGESGTVRKVSEESQRYEIQETGWGPNLVARQIGDYMFMSSEEDASELNRRFPNPERLVSKLSSRYDIAYSLLIKNVPPATKTLFLEFFKNQALAGLQQRDGEPDAAYRVRRASGESLIDLFDMLVKQGEELTVGGFADLQTETAFGELEINGTKDSGLARFFQDLAGRRSYFEAAADSAATFSLNVSMQLDEKRRRPFVELFSVAPGFVADGLKNAGKSEESAEPTEGFFESLRNTAEDGHLDLLVQLSGETLGDYTIVGGLRVLGVGDFPKQVHDLLKFGRDVVADSGRSGPVALADSLELNSTTLAGHFVHRLPVPAPRDTMGKLLLGEAPNLYLCATPQALWFAIGSETAARDQLQKSLEVVANPPAASGPRPLGAPLQFTTHASQWVSLRISDPTRDISDSQRTQLELFTPDNDEWRTTGRPTDQGVRVRTELQSGYFAWLGGFIAGQVDSEVDRSVQRAERLRQRQLRRQQNPAQQ